MATKLEQFLERIQNAKRMVFLGGAGVSTASGIPDFRGAQGLYRGGHDVLPEEILSHDFFDAHPEVFFEFYKKRMINASAKPNLVHEKLAALERAGRLLAVVTQNIDGLHQKAGSKTVYELHGSVYRNFCVRCGRKYDLAYILAREGVPRCSCGGMVRPDVVLYGERLGEAVMEKSVAAIRASDLLVVGGTSLNVYPAAGMAGYAGGGIVIVNMEPTPLDARANVTLHEDLCDVFSEIKL